MKERRKEGMKGQGDTRHSGIVYAGPVLAPYSSISAIESKQKQKVSNNSLL